MKFIFFSLLLLCNLNKRTEKNVGNIEEKRKNLTDLKSVTIILIKFSCIINQLGQNRPELCNISLFYLSFLS